MAVIDETFGAALVGLVVGACLYGVTLLQTYGLSSTIPAETIVLNGARNYANDAKSIKALVVILTVLDTLHLILCTKAIYWYLVSNFGDVDNLDVTSWSMALQTDCNGLIGLIVETFFARRVWMMSRNWLITGIIVVLACLHFASDGSVLASANFAGLGVVFTVESFSKFGRLTWVTSVGLGSAAVSDILIAIAMCYYLYTKRTGLRRTDSVVTTLMVYSINSGLTTSIIASICVVTFAAMPTNFIWLSFFWIMGKCYVNSFLALLNSRESLRDKVSAAVQLNKLNGPQSLVDPKSPSKTGRFEGGVSVQIETITDYGHPPFYGRKSLSRRPEQAMDAITENKEDIRDDQTSSTYSAPLPPTPGLCLLQSQVLSAYSSESLALVQTFVASGLSAENTVYGGALVDHSIRMSLRDKLLAALADLPGTRSFHIHVLTSSPRKHNGLFPYAHPRPRAYLQDILVLLSEQASSDAPHVLVTAIEASVYNVPSTSCGMLYVSKVDSSGHASAPSPTATLVRAFITYYADPVTRPISVQHLWVQLFARAQNQYLFPNSSEYEGKRPLSDTKLCAWWKRVYSEVAAEVDARLKGTGKVRLYYILPGYSELEAAYTISRALSRAGPASVQWTYGHPYSQREIPLPCPQNADPDAPHNLGQFIPWFEDDPKSRFIDEIAYIKTTEGGVRSPQRKRPRAPTSSGPRGEKKPPRERESVGDDKEKEKDKDERPHIQGELGQVSPDEFWERMSFRQECVAGAVTGFFTLAVSTPPAVNVDKTSQPSPLAPQPGQVSSKMVRRIVASLMNHHEFSTRDRAVRATETLEGAIKGLCDDAPAIHAAAPPASSSSSSAAPADERPRTPEPSERDVLDVPRTPPPRRAHLSAGGGAKPGGLPEISPNPFPDPVPTPETYAGYIYGTIEVRNAPLPPRTGGDGAAPSGSGGTEGSGASGQGNQGSVPVGAVTVLAVRKKRKPAPA
ncbi:histone acetylation protein-domain-containing protein [Daedaleopsis nitida]|nr:histone acetylation protein-domain-containing protein [Daedaleopsis nitida]